MNFEHTVWPIKKLVQEIDGKVLELSPHYQRNLIWSAPAQKELLETVFRRRPMPNFFLRRLSDESYEMVDGQQRARTLAAFVKGLLDTHQGKFFSQILLESPVSSERFLEYELSVTIITHLDPGEHIETFYKLINSTGLRLNSAEIRKAEFYQTRLLRLVTTVASIEDFKGLGLFTKLSSARMNDIDFASELVAQMEFGITDKKDKVDDLYEVDISEARCKELLQEFVRIIAIFKSAENIVPIAKTRYRQKNDFYTLFGFLHRHKEVTEKEWAVFFRLLVRIGSYIRPSQEKCESMMNYALSCVTQSNSKNARQHRLAFIEELLLNSAAEPTAVQSDLLFFFRLDSTALISVSGFTIIDPALICDPEQSEMDF